MGVLNHTSCNVITSESIEREIKTAMREIRIANRGLPEKVELVLWRFWFGGTYATLQIVYTDGDGKTQHYNVAM